MKSKVEQNENLSSSGQSKSGAFRESLNLRFPWRAHGYKGGGLYSSVHLILDSSFNC
jgi:hypothetical protein